MRENHIITRIVVHSAPSTRRKALFAEHELIDGIGQKEIEFFARVVPSCEACGHITAKDLKAPTVDHFMETSTFNGCLNRKISIDVRGDIRNCPSIRKDFGNITSMRLADVVRQAEFRRVWSIAKDSIDVCKDCELRYACTDCRAYTVDDNPLGKPSRCVYDPYTGVWNESNPRDQLSPEFTHGAFHE